MDVIGAEEIIFGHHEVDGRRLDGVHASDRLGELTLQRPLVRDPLLELGRGDALLVEVSESRFRKEYWTKSTGRAWPRDSAEIEKVVIEGLKLGGLLPGRSAR